MAHKVNKDDMYANAYGVDLTVQVEKGGKGRIKLARPSGNDFDDADSMTDLNRDLVILGEGFEDGEVVLNFDQLDGPSYNTRISAQAVDGKFRAIPPYGFTPGKYRITAYSPREHDISAETQRIMKMTDQVDLTITSHTV